MKKNSTVLNRFELKKLLGSTTLGEVWLADDIKAKRKVSLKIINVSLLSGKGEVRRLKKEFKIFSQIKSDNIAGVYGLFEENNKLFFSMEYIEGVTLPELKKATVVEKMRCFLDITRGLLDIHSYGIVHGDLKPQDIVVTPNGSAKLVDNGLLSSFGKKSAKSRSDYSYTAPEIINYGVSDWRSDFYSLGVILHESLFNKLPWKTPPFIEQDGNDSVANIQFPENAPAEIKKLVLKMISTNPADRFSDTAGLLCDIEKTVEIIDKIGREDVAGKRVPICETDFISRKSEMASLIELMDNFEATSIDHAVIIEAPGGSGRTRFLKEFEKRVVSRNINILFFSANQTQYLLYDLIKALWESLDRELKLQLSFKWKGNVPFYFPQFYSYGEFKNSPETQNLLSAREDFFRLLSMFKDFIKMATKNKPLVLMIDNFDHVDKRSLKIIQEITASIDNTNRLFTIITVDPESGSNIEIPAFSRIILSALTFSESREFIESALQKSEDEIDNELFLWIFRNSRGLAKLIRSLLFLLSEERLIFEKGSRIFFKNRNLGEKGVEKLLKAKVSSFPPKEQQILKASSVYLRFITREALYAIVSNKMNEEEFDSALSVLESNYLLRLHKNGKINIVNKIFKPILYSMLTRAEKIEIHKRFGDYIIGTWKDLLEMKINHFAFAAFHYNEAGETEKALRLYLQSVGGFFANLNSELAEISLDNALSIVKSNPKLTPGKKKYGVYLFAGRMYYRLGIYNKALPLLEKCYSVWEKDDTILEDLVFSLAGNSQPKKALKFISNYKADTKDKKAFKHYLKAYMIVAIGGDHQKSYFHMIRAIGLVKKGYGKLFGPIRNFNLRQLEFDHHILLGLKEYDFLKKIQLELVESALKLETRSFMIDALFASFRFHWHFNELKDAYKVLHETLKLSVEIFDNYRITKSYLNLAACSHRLGRFNDVRFYLEKSLEYARKGCGAGILKQCYINYGELALIRGEFSIAENYCNSAENISSPELQDTDLIDIYSLQILLALLKNEAGFARSIGGKLRRYFEQFENISHSKKVIYYSVMMFMESLTGSDRSFFDEIEKKLGEILEEYPIYKGTYSLVRLMCKMIYHMKRGDRNSAMNIIHDVEQNEIKSSHSLYQMLYFYHAGLFLKEYAPGSSLLKKYVEEGLAYASRSHASHFFTLFDEISYTIERDSTENAVIKIKSSLKHFDLPGDILSEVESYIENLQKHIHHSKNHIDYLRSLNHSYAAVIDIVKSIAGRTELYRIIDIVVKKVIDLLSLDICGIVFHGSEKEEKNYLILDSTYREYKMGEIRFKAGLIPRMLKSGRIEFVSGTPLELFSETSENTGFHSVAAVPVAVKGIITSYFYLERDTAKGSLTESEIKFMEMLAENVAVIFDNIELMQIATTDVLTKLHSRRHFMSILSKEVEKASRYGFVISLILIDIDHFKKVNDTYGHLAGDAVLRMIGKMLKNSVRSSDYVGRIGGEEFAILLTGTDREGAYRTAEKIRKKCEQSDFSGVNATISAGVSSFHEDRVKNEKDFIEKSDMALYKAKEKGRNLSVKYSDQ